MALRTTLGDLLHDAAGRYWDRPFVTQAETGESVSYGGFEVLTNRLAHGLRGFSGAPSGYAAILLENSIAYLAASYALKKLGWVEVSINRAFRGAALARMIAMTGADLLFTSPAHLPALAEIAGEIPELRRLVMVGGTEEARRLFPKLPVIAFEEVLSEQATHLAPAAEDSDLATILFTSGTTGPSKGCLLSHRYAVRTAEHVIPAFRVTAEDCVYTPYPLSHIGAAYYDVLPALMTGGRVVLRERFSASAFWPEVRRYGVTWFMMLGSVQQLLWAALPCPEERDHAVTRCWGTPIPVPKADFEARFGLHLVPGGGYGSTDAGWVVAPDWDHPGGHVLPHYEVAIVDDKDDPLPPNTPGELVLRPKEAGIMADGYFGQPEKTLESRRNLWFHTGDIAKLDEAGRFYFLHRMSERIRVRGEMVSAYEVEEVALAHPAVEDCAAVGVPSDLGEEDIRLFVVAKPDTDLDAEGLRQHCAQRMAKFMVPRDIVFIDAMPRTPTGKPEKGKLARL